MASNPKNPTTFRGGSVKCEEIRNVLLSGDCDCGLVLRRRFLENGVYWYVIQCACGKFCGGGSPREAEKWFEIHLGEKKSGVDE
jgi:hypothetical protein